MTRLTKFVRQKVAAALRDRSGTIALVTGFTFTAVVGFVGLGTEASFWYVKKRAIQGAVDSASFTAASALMNGETSTTFIPAARAIAAQYGFVDGTDNVTVSVNSPPATGPNASNSSAIEVIITQPQSHLISALFLPAPSCTGASPHGCIMGRAVALVSPAAYPPCLVALETGNVQDVTGSGSAVLNMPGCNMYVNSSSPNALTGSGTMSVTDHATYVDGGINGNLGNFHGDVHQNTGTPLADPFADKTFTTPAGCDQSSTTMSISNTRTLQPGNYCGGIKISSGGNVTLAPGTYYMKGGDALDPNHAGFAVTGTGTVSGQGVSIVLTNNSGGPYATVNISGTGTVSLNNAANSPVPPLGELSFFQDRNAPNTPNLGTTPSNTFSGGSNLNIGYGIYFPKQLVTYSGGAALGSGTSATCTELVVYRASVSGTTNFGANCGTLGTGAGGLSGTQTVSLVE